jgi:glutamate-1-semialdehyde 2,1-aminomutase
MIAGLTAMQMMTPDEYDRVGRLGDRVRDEANRMFEERGTNWQMTGLSNMFRLHPSRRPIRNYRDSWRDSAENERAGKMYHTLMGHGVMLTPDGMGNISTAMDDNDVDQILNALSSAIAQLD